MENSLDDLFEYQSAGTSQIIFLKIINLKRRRKNVSKPLEVLDKEFYVFVGAKSLD